ncbi:disease resistance protein RPV1-like [Ziziphus jujuba]|uniref:Disease resistance protein RPV1-like n=1 Tax=Ziziphus jujuba TaxID=326968 RepID=A0ABM3IB16_ZIZJJ|nr:disease resistance protein RPV1-like [Ziziphus jujuba]
MASFSSSAMVSHVKHDVFLSLRGCDTRSNFVSHLHAALLRNQIQTYMDHRLDRGEEISPAFCKAIQESMISVVIFSQNYASSTWCLDKLVQMLECKRSNGQIIIPVFYKMDPSHVQKQKGNNATGLNELEKHFRDKIQRWRAALTEAANLSGRDS